MNALAMALALLGASHSGAQGEPAGRCRIKEDPPATRLIAAAHYEATTYSTAWLGDPEETTGVVDVRVDPGDPVHLVLETSDPTIYRFSGDIRRVRHLTLISGDGAGAVGLDRRRVSFLPDCLSYDDGKDEAVQFAAAVARLYARKPHAVVIADGLWRLRIGSGIQRLTLRGWTTAADPETQRMLTNSPGGVARIDPAAVVSNVAVGAYEVLPQDAGLRQLLSSGALIRATIADAEAWEAAARARGVIPAERPNIEYHAAYRVIRPIQVPAGLCGAYDVGFYLPSPEYLRGDICHSELFFDDGTNVGGYRP